MAKKKKNDDLNIEELLANENIIDSEITNEIEHSILNYALKTIRDRALPDARDGLKPVQRRILYTAYVNGWVSNKPRTKCASIVGTTIARFHPTGDASVYEALVNLSQNWSCRYPLIDFRGK